MMSSETPKSASYGQMVEVFSQAVECGADSIELERDSGGDLEVMFMVGNTGRGIMLDGDVGQSLIETICEEKRKAKGQYRVQLAGKDYMVRVQTYGHFGENAFRLTIREARRSKNK